MTHEFDQEYWERHWNAGGAAVGVGRMSANPYVATETAGLTVGSALDAGCGNGGEALWLAQRGWQVTGADISASALATAGARARESGLEGAVEWVEADLATWEPGRTWDLVVTSYAHPATGQLDFYRWIGEWVAPGGTLLIIGHGHDDHTGHGHPEHATATVDGAAALFGGSGWEIDASYETTRVVETGRGRTELNDVVVRARRV
ncbi:class I SAM-dependent methyltransferase [Aeromicrobium sp. YIM 150415]|uniref:class I SAM-dependent methyltransferase n=1 Tax=Aeromicrobium sp. YIM 150415 TaxID=2803912 RepID=UPI001963F8EF|nr:class I SAM-dependent methyltransferase [Aeromicrobium sp. YIM 150415]MBM9464414.1 class I SAM-dependent methyltransferase [Aeromicrobium sp. YIM 150415]